MSLRCSDETVVTAPGRCYNADAHSDSEDAFVTVKWEEKHHFRGTSDPFARLLLVLKREDEDGVANELLGHAEVELRTLLASQGQAQEHVLALLDRAGRKTGGRLRLVLRWHRAAATTSTAAASAPAPG